MHLSLYIHIIFLLSSHYSARNFSLDSFITGRSWKNIQFALSSLFNSFLHKPLECISSYFIVWNSWTRIYTIYAPVPQGEIDHFSTISSEVKPRMFSFFFIEILIILFFCKADTLNIVIKTLQSKSVQF